MYVILSVTGWIWAIVVLGYVLIRPAKKSMQITDEKHR
jgi:hypothetical protein